MLIAPPGESMPLDAARLDEMRANIAIARKRPLAFGLCLGKAPETTVLVNHKMKDPEFLGRLAKKEGETTKVAFGMMSVEGKNLNFSCIGDVVPGLARKTKEMLKAAGLKFKVRILDAEGNVLEENGDEEDEEDEGDAGRPDAPSVAAAPAQDDEPDPQKVKWVETKPRVEEALVKAGASASVDLSKARATWAVACTKAEADDYPGAMGAATEAVRQIALAVAAARTAADEAARWTAAAAKVAPVVASVAQSLAPEAKKIMAYWSFAQSKATAPVPDFAAALTAIATLAKMIQAFRAKMTPAEQAKTPAPPGVEAPSVTSDENERLDKLSPEELAKTDLTVGDTKKIFSDAYMLKLKDEKIKGEEDPDLKKLMQEIAKGPLSDKRLLPVMQALSGIVGSPPSAKELADDYGRFLIVRKQQQAIGKQKSKEVVPDLDEEKHKDFMASRGQLMFGKALGEAFGIHEVFASLLSPTGGLVGAGNSSLHLDPDNPVAIHGTVHDAAGYLATYHNEGPGYNYLESDIEVALAKIPLIRDRDYLSGQLTGVAFWVKEAGPDYIEKQIDEAVVAVEKKLKSARDTVSNEIDKLIDEAKKKAAKAKAEAAKIADKAEKKALEVAEAIEDAKNKAKKSAVEKTDAAIQKIGEIKDEAKQKLEAAWDSIWS